MRELIVLAVIASLVSTPVIVVAGLILAAVIIVAAVLLLRSSGKKGAKAVTTNGMADWQRQGQQGGTWGQQGVGNPTDNAWGQQGQQPGWGGQNATQQPGGWGGQNAAQQPGGWGGMQSTPSQQASASPWGAQPGAAPQQSANAWGGQGQGTQSGWEATQFAGPQQDSWGQQQSAGAQPGPSWGGQGNVSPKPQQPQQAQTGYGGSGYEGGGSGQSWGQPSFGSGQAADPWGVPAAQQQYQGGSLGMPATPSAGPSAMPSSWGPAGKQDQDATISSSDGDRTIMRTTGPSGLTGQQPGALGIVRVEEGKEPGRVYEVRKESLSIGRSRESDIFLEDLAVSRLHASIVNTGNGGYALKDEGSANGTKVNGQLVNKYQNYTLKEGDRIQLGQTVLVFGKR